MQVQKILEEEHEISSAQMNVKWSVYAKSRSHLQCVEWFISEQFE